MWWTYPRGSLHYDVMVTLILLFIFISPHFLNFKDKPAERTPHPIGVVVAPEGNDGFVYRIEAVAVAGKSKDELPDSLMNIIEPIAGEVKFVRYEPVLDTKGVLIAYKVWVRRGIGG